MSWSFEEIKARGNAAVAFALDQARQAFHKGCLDLYVHGLVRGQILIAHCDLFADTYIAQSARNEIDFLYGQALAMRGAQ